MSATTVRDVMTSPAVTITAGTGLKEAAGRLRSGGFSALPVVDTGGRVIGILSEADLLTKAERPAPAAVRSHRQRGQAARQAGTLACHLMSRPAVTIGPEALLDEAAHLLHRHGLGRLPVVDEAGRPIGVVSRGDLLRAFLRPDEEIRRDVLERLDAELTPALVGVEDGVVTLRFAAIDGSRAGRLAGIAERVDGVVAVRYEPRDGPAASSTEGRYMR